MNSVNQFTTSLTTLLSTVLATMLSIALLVWTAQPVLAQQAPISKTIELASGESISAEVFGFDATGTSDKIRVLWIASGFGFQERHQQVAAALGQDKLEIWLVDLPDALFLTSSVQTLRSIPGSLVADLIAALSAQDHRKLLIISSSYGAIPTLRGIHSWQARLPEHDTLIGAILFSPAFFTHIPTLGETPTYIPELEATSAPLYIFQEEKNSRRWYLPDILQALQKHAPVYTEILKGVTSVFNPGDTSEESLGALARMPTKIIRASKQLQLHKIPLEAIPLNTIASTPPGPGLDTQLKPYRGTVLPTPFSLIDTSGDNFKLDSYSGQVTLINFWASWCRPCVLEIPSLNRLKQAMAGKPFRLISINYAEDAALIREFMQKVAVDFPVLLDPEGKLASQWKIVALPSTFVIGPDGKIHAGVNAAIHWDTPAVIKQINQLMPTP